MPSATKTPSQQRPNTALLVIDVQEGVVVNAHDRDAVVTTIGKLVDNARAAAIPVIWIQHNDADMPADGPGWAIVDELTPGDGESIVHKNFRDSFEQTTLEAELAERDVGHLIVTGAQSDFCVRWTLHGAHTRGYATTLVADAHTTEDAPTNALPTAAQTIALMNTVWGTQSAPGRTAAVAKSADINW